MDRLVDLCGLGSTNYSSRGYQADEGAGRIGAPREPENIDFVARGVVKNECAIGIRNVWDQSDDEYSTRKAISFLRAHTLMIKYLLHYSVSCNRNDTFSRNDDIGGTQCIEFVPGTIEAEYQTLHVDPHML